MSKLTIIANITAHPEQVERIKTELEKIVPPTRKEAGCLQYDLQQNNRDATHFVMFENWESYAHWQAHLDSLHFKAFVSATEGALAKLEIHEMTQIR